MATRTPKPRSSRPTRQGTCLVVDYKLPGMNGLELLRELRAANPGARYPYHHRARRCAEGSGGGRRRGHRREAFARKRAQRKHPQLVQRQSRVSVNCPYDTFAEVFSPISCPSVARGCCRRPGIPGGRGPEAGRTPRAKEICIRTERWRLSVAQRFRHVKPGRAGLAMVSAPPGGSALSNGSTRRRSIMAASRRALFSMRSSRFANMASILFAATTNQFGRDIAPDQTSPVRGSPRRKETRNRYRRPVLYRNVFRKAMKSPI